MKTSTWLGILSISALAMLAWLTHHPRPRAPRCRRNTGLVQSVATASEPQPARRIATPVSTKPRRCRSRRARARIWLGHRRHARFHTYTFQQRITALIDWYGVLRSEARDTPFRTWGLINDPAAASRVPMAVGEE